METHIDIYSPDYTLNGLVAERYLKHEEIEEMLALGYTKEIIVKKIEQILTMENYERDI